MIQYQAKVAEYKVSRVNELLKLMQDYPLVGIVNMENIPAKQLQRMRAQLRGRIELTVAKKALINRAIDAAEPSKKDLKALKEHVIGMPGLIFTKDNPFKLASMLRKSKTSAPAKAGQIAPRDITIPAGPTQFAPGPIISELSSVGLKTGVEAGKVSIRQDHVIVHEGEKFSQKVSEVLAKLGIFPMEIGLDLVAIYENSIIYARDVLSVDEQQYMDNVLLAFQQALALSVSIGYATKDNIKVMIGKAFNDAKYLALSKELVSDVVVQKMMTDAERAAMGIHGQLPQEALVSEAPAAEETPVPEKKEELAEKTSAPKPEEKEAAPEAAKADKVEAEIDQQISEMKKEKEEEDMESELFDEVKEKMKRDKEIAKKLGDIKKHEQEKAQQDEAEHNYEELKKKGSLRKEK